MSCNRVTKEEVLGLIPETTLTNLKSQMMCANELVNELALSDCGSGFSDNKLRCIEMNLAAGFAQIADPLLMITVEKVEGSSSTISRGNTSSKTGFMSTTFGQLANTMSGGCLQELELTPVSFFTV